MIYTWDLIFHFAIPKNISSFQYFALMDVSQALHIRIDSGTFERALTRERGQECAANSVCTET